MSLESPAMAAVVPVTVMEPLPVTAYDVAAPAVAVAAGAVQVMDAVLPLAALAATPVTGPGGWGMRMVLLVAVALVPLTLTAATDQE